MSYKISLFFNVFFKLQLQLCSTTVHFQHIFHYLYILATERQTWCLSRSLKENAVRVFIIIMLSFMLVLTWSNDKQVEGLYRTEGYFQVKWQNLEKRVALIQDLSRPNAYPRYVFFASDNNLSLPECFSKDRGTEEFATRNCPKE